MIRRPPRSTRFPYTTLVRSAKVVIAVKTGENGKLFGAITNKEVSIGIKETFNLDIDRKKIECNIKAVGEHIATIRDRKSTRLNSSHANISYAVFCLKKKKTIINITIIYL